MPPLLDMVLLIGSAVVIYFACEAFVNGVEWVGRRMSVNDTATGTILAAFGTALPESVVTLTAVAFGHGPAATALGVGAALGGPLALSTIAYATVGITLLLARQKLDSSPQLQRDFRRLSDDQCRFLVIFAVKIGVGLIAFAWKPWLGLLFLATWAVYLRREMARADSDPSEEPLEPLMLARRRPEPPLALALVQTLAAMAVIFAASQVFVGRLGAVAVASGLSPQLTALLLSPIATELPETLNAVIWVRQGKHRLALANISGAMMIQATVPTAFGLFWTPWLLDRPLLIGAAVTAVAVAAMFFAFRSGMISRRFMAAMGALYLVFIVLIAAT